MAYISLVLFLFVEGQVFQMAAVASVLVVAVAYALWRVVGRIRRANNPCATCEGCPLKAAKQKNNKKAVCDKKTRSKIW